jgi:hypothetical protein
MMRNSNPNPGLCYTPPPPNSHTIVLSSRLYVAFGQESGEEFDLPTELVLESLTTASLEKALTIGISGSGNDLIE